VSKPARPVAARPAVNVIAALLDAIAVGWDRAWAATGRAPHGDGGDFLDYHELGGADDHVPAATVDDGLDRLR
jgi:hypothetical protein